MKVNGCGMYLCAMELSNSYLKEIVAHGTTPSGWGCILLRHREKIRARPVGSQQQ